MPELPDVEIFKQLFDRHCPGRVITGVDVADPGSVARASLPYMQKSLTGSRIRSCRRYGKYLIIDCDGAGSLAIHFGTNGSLRFVAATPPDPSYVRVSLVFESGDRLAYVNPRRIGQVRLVESADVFIAETGLGPDASDPSLDGTAFAGLLATSRRPVKAALMDQARVAGIGNIYGDEILFHARLHPGIITATLSQDQTHRLFESMRSVLRTAIDRGAGAEGFTDRLPRDFLLPQRHAGGRCPRCGTAIQSVKIGGRTSYFCPICQPRSDQ